MNPPAAICLVMLACLLLAAGRFFIRRGRRSDPHRRLPQKLLGWAFLFAGLLAMIFGVLLW